MKVGIITFHQAFNYGAVLQAYALYKSVSKLGGECEIIDYRNTHFNNIYKKIDWKKSKNLRAFISAILFGKTRNRKIEGFMKFVDNNCKISSNTYSTESIDSIDNYYDVVITGSDQVWNLELTDEDYHYFLDFVPNGVRKCSYAASIVYNNISFGQEDHIKNLLLKFDYITLRENSGKSYISKLLEKDNISVVLDPSLLLNKNEWKNLAKDNVVNSILPNKYILAYFVSPNDDHYLQAKKISKQLGLPIVLINYTHKKIKGVVNMRTVSPGQFVYLIEHSEFVVTNSFHGTAFAINLQKNFTFILNEKHPEKNERITTLINALGLENRNIKDFSINEKIKWDIVTNKLEALRKYSLNELSKELTGE